MATLQSREQVLDIIERQAQQRGIPRDDFMRFAYIETGGRFDPNASRGEGGAKGLFQFVPLTAAAYGISGRELDPVANTDAAARLYQDNRRALLNDHERDGRPYLSGQPQPNGLDLYLAHQEGVGGYQSLQAAMATGHFSRSDTKANLLNNINSSDIEKLTGTSYDQFKKMSDRDMATTFTHYWEAKYDRIHIPEKNIRPLTASADVPITHGGTYRTLAQGDSSVAVVQLQIDLNHLGYTDANGKPLKADGDFGPATQAAVEAFQRDHHLAVDGKVGPQTLAALHTELQAHPAAAKVAAPGLDDPKNPDHALYEQALAGVRQLDAQAGRASDQHSANLAAALVVAAKKEGMTRIDHVALSTDDGSRVFAVQSDASVHKYANVPTLPSLNTPIDKSSAQAHQLNQAHVQQVSPQPIAPQAPAQATPASAMSR